MYVFLPLLGLAAPTPVKLDASRTRDPATSATPANGERGEPNMVVIPIVARSEETRFQFGAAGIYLFPRFEKPTLRSKLTAAVLVGLRTQFIARIAGNAYLLGDKRRASATFDARRS
jgi:hypothetical protein